MIYIYVCVWYIVAWWSFRPIWRVQVVWLRQKVLHFPKPKPSSSPGSYMATVSSVSTNHFKTVMNKPAMPCCLGMVNESHLYGDDWPSALPALPAPDADLLPAQCRKSSSVGAGRWLNGNHGSCHVSIHGMLGYGATTGWWCTLW